MKELYILIFSKEYDSHLNATKSKSIHVSLIIFSWMDGIKFYFNFTIQDSTSSVIIFFSINEINEIFHNTHTHT